MLSPKRVKWRKVQKGKMRGTASFGGELAYGEWGLQSADCGRINSRQIEAARIAMTRYIKRGGDIWIRVFPHKPVTKKPAETRMGKGKGSVEEWVAVLKPKSMIFEMSGVAPELAQEALRLANNKLPIKCKIVSRESQALAKKIEEEKRATKRAAKAAREAAATA